MNAYAGIGSRDTPLGIQIQMTEIARQLRGHGFVLRSGAAKGADQAFERGALDQKEIFIPWNGFEGRQQKPELDLFPELAADIAAQFHPTWDRLSPGAKKLMARTSYQVLGPQLNDPSKFVICWTPGGRVTGGTGQALRIAAYYLIPVYNLASMSLQEVEDELNKRFS